MATIVVYADTTPREVIAVYQVKKVIDSFDANRKAIRNSVGVALAFEDAVNPGGKV